MTKTELREQQQEQLMEAYERLNARTPAEVRRNIYKSLIYFWLYEDPPDSFTKAIFYGEQYVDNPRTLPSGAIWLNLACAYAQKADWLLGDRFSFSRRFGGSPINTRISESFSKTLKSSSLLYFLASGPGPVLSG
jgi:hypothetical protein